MLMLKILLYSKLPLLELSCVHDCAIFIAVASLFYWQWELYSLAVGTSFGNGISRTGSENASCILFPTFARECRAPRSQDRGRRDNYRQGSKVKEQAPKALMAIDRVGWDWKSHALIADEETPTEFALMAKTSAESEVIDNSLCSKAWLAQVEARLAENRNQELKYCEKIRVLEFKTESRANCIESLTKDLELLKKEKGYSAVPPPPTQVYSPPKKDMPSPAIESTSNNAQNRNPSVTETEASPNTNSPKPFIKFVKANDSLTKSKTDKVETAKKPPVKYAEQYRKPTKKTNVRGNQRNWNNLKSHQLGGCKITGKGTIKTGKLEFENVYFMKDLKNKEMDDFCSQKGIKREFSNVRTPQQNGVAERRNRTLIEAARTMLADAKLPVTFWAEAVNTACYVQNRVLVNKSHNKTPYELFTGRSPAIGFLKPFGCHVMILNTLDDLGKFEAKGDEGYFIGYSMSSKAFRVFIKRTKRVKENLHVEFLKNKAIEKGAGPNWLFDIDSLTKSMNYVPVVAGTNSTNLSGTKDAASQEMKKDVSYLRYIALPNWVHDALLQSSSSRPQDDCSTDVPESSGNFNPTATPTNPSADQMETLIVETPIPTVSSPVPTACFTDSQEPSSDTRLISNRFANHVETPSLDNLLTLTNRFEDILGVTTNSAESNGVEADVSNMETTIIASPTPTLRIHKDHPKSQIIGPVDTSIETRNKSKEMGEQKPKKISDALQDPSWVEAMQEELLQFKIQNVWTLVDCPKGVRPIGTKWVLKNKKDKRGIIIRNKARLVAQGHTQEERIDYDEVFALVARIKAIRLFLAYASFMGFTVYQMDVKSAFLYGTIDEEVSSNTPMDKENPWGKDGTRKDVDLYLYRSMIGSLMYLTASRPDIMFAVCACARHQLTPKECHLHVVKRIFIYLKGHPKLGLWYPKESPFDLVAYSDNDYGGATQDRKSTTGGCQFLGRRLISWQCKKQIIVATLTTAAEYVAAASGCGQVLWIQNQLLDYGLSMPCEALSKEISSFILRLIETTEEGTKILATIDGKLRTVSESSIMRNLKLNNEAGISSLPDAELFENLQLMGYNILPNQKFTFQKGQFSHEPASPLRDVSQGEAYPTVSSLDVEQDTANIAKTSTLPHESTSRDPSLGELEITMLKARVKLLEDKEGGVADQLGDDAPIKGRRLDAGEEATERVSDDTEEMETVLTSMDAATVLSSGAVEVPTSSGSIPTPGPPATGEETERFKRKGLRLEQVSEKKLKTSEEVPEEVKATEEVPKDKVKEMMQLVPVEEETLSIRPPTNDKEMRLWVELKRLYEPNDEDQLWTHTQNLMHAPVEWKLYDTCGVHHVTFKDKQIFMLMEKDYPLRKGLAIVMISYKLQVENYS
nr:hypothetical protein [Tanacetum cinerariifolium]